MACPCAGRKQPAAKPPISPIPSPHAAPSDSSLPAVRATLVICPLVAVIQWRQEIARFTAPGSVKVLPVCRFFRPESSPVYASSILGGQSLQARAADEEDSVVAVILWRQEIARFTAPGSVKVTHNCTRRVCRKLVQDTLARF